MSNKYCFFWSANSPFSNWHNAKFIENGIEYNCTEQYMMYQKAILFNDIEIANKILAEVSPRNQKRLGRMVKNFDQNIWSKNCMQIVYNGNKLKFTQNPHLLKQLLNTKGLKMVEASPYDRIWGIGMSKEEAVLVDESQWRGHNYLGRILTKLRDDLLNQQ